MAEYAWREFLGASNAATFTAAGASEAALRAAEARLGATLPPSYRQFLAASNGCPLIALDYLVEALWPAETIEWLARIDDEHSRLLLETWAPEIADGVDPQIADYLKNLYGQEPEIPDAVYLDYSPGRTVEAFRREYLPAALQISAWGDEQVFLLNPKIVTPDGEWEAWDFALFYPGAVRYPSFWELMQAVYRGRAA